MVKLFRKNSNLCDHNLPTLQTDGQTTCDRNTALCTEVHRAVKTTSFVLSLFSFKLLAVAHATILSSSAARESAFTAGTTRYVSSANFTNLLLAWLACIRTNRKLACFQWFKFLSVSCHCKHSSHAKTAKTTRAREKSNTNSLHTKHCTQHIISYLYYCVSFALPSATVAVRKNSEKISFLKRLQDLGL